MRWWFRERVDRDKTPLSNLKAADRFAAALVKAINKTGRRKRFDDLRHLVTCSEHSEEPLPRSVRVGQEWVRFGALVGKWRKGAGDED